MNNEQETVYVVDDDPAMLKALLRMLKVAELKAVGFSCAREFLKAQPLANPACVVADVCMPGLNGLELQREMARKNIHLPIVFMTGHGTIQMGVQAMKAGAIDFLEKPFEEKELLRLIRHALDKARARANTQAECAEIQSRLATLTPREQEVLLLVVRGLLNKQVAAELGTSERTIKVHRHRLMRKMQVDSVAELVKASVKIGLIGI